MQDESLSGIRSDSNGPDVEYSVTKTFGWNLGYSTTFRQPRATSHCGWLHGYALGFAYTVAAPRLNDQRWVFDFAKFKPIKAWMSCMFDHTTLIASYDPMLSEFIRLNGFDPRDRPEPVEPVAWTPDQPHKLIDLRIVDSVGCESFAEMGYRKANAWLRSLALDNGAYLKSVTVSEHGANSATVTRI